MRALLALAAAAALASLAAADMRQAEDFKISLYGEITGLSVTIQSATIENGIPPAGVVTRRVNARDPMGADHHLSYRAESNDDVIVLEHHADVLGVDCGTPGQLTVKVASVEHFLAHLPADPDTVLFVLGPGWGCTEPNPAADADADTASNSSSTPPPATTVVVVDDEEEGALVHGLSVIEPDGDTLYLRSTGMLDTTDDGVLTFSVTQGTVMDAFLHADISYTRTMDPEEQDRLDRVKQQAKANADAAAAAAAAEAAASNTTAPPKRRRLTLAQAYMASRVPDDHPDAAHAPGLTPHKRALRRLQLTTSVVNGATGYWTPCVAWSERCVWGVTALYT
jgi:hypothetical protein